MHLGQALDEVSIRLESCDSDYAIRRESFVKRLSRFNVQRGFDRIVTII